MGSQDARMFAEAHPKRKAINLYCNGFTASTASPGITYLLFVEASRG